MLGRGKEAVKFLDAEHTGEPWARADGEGVPAYIVFSDAVLARLAAARPTDEAGLLAVPGVGPTKLARYGAAFLRVLREG